MRIGLDISLLGFKQQTGVGQVAESVTSALINQYPQVDFELLACLPRADMKRVKNLSFIKADNVRLTSVALPHKIFTQTANCWQKSPMPVELAMGRRLDVFHHFDWYVYPSLAPLTSTIYDLTPVKEPQWHTKEQVKLFKVWQSLIHARAKHAFAISEMTRQDLIDVFPDMENITSVAYLGSDLTAVMADGRTWEQVRKTYRLPAKYFLCVGTLEPRKNLAATIEAFSKLHNEDKETHLVVVGAQGWDKEAVYDLKSTGVHYLDYVPRQHLSALYQGSVALVYPSLYEGFGLPVVEALACGTLVITSFTSSLPETGGQAAYYVDPYRPDSLCMIMKQVLALNPAKRQQRIISGTKQADKFSYRNTAGAMMAVWQKIISKGAR